MFLNVDNAGAERMCSGRLFQATGPATQNARLPSCSFVLATCSLLTEISSKVLERLWHAWLHWGLHTRRWSMRLPQSSDP